MNRKDIILIISILIMGISGMLLIQAMDNENSGKTATILVNNQVVKKIPIDNIEEVKAFSFKFGDNIGYLDVKDGAVSMREMDKKVCPKKICSDTGWISKSYESIVCLPNRIAVNIENGETGKEDSNLADEVSY